MIDQNADPALIQWLQEELEHLPPFTREEVLSLETCHIDYARDISLVWEFDHFIGLFFTGCELEKFHQLRVMKKILILEIQYTPLKSIEFIRDMLALKMVKINNTLVEDIRPLLDLRNLSNIDLRGIPMTEECFFEILPAIKEHEADIQPSNEPGDDRRPFITHSTEEEWRLTRELFERGLRLNFYQAEQQPVTFIAPLGLKHTPHPEWHSVKITADALRQQLQDPELTIESLLNYKEPALPSFEESVSSWPQERTSNAEPEKPKRSRKDRKRRKRARKAAKKSPSDKTE